MDKKLAFALGGGGSRGALQVGALYALMEYGIQPDIVVGTSIGAVNAAFLALNGFSKDSLHRLTEAWHVAGEYDLLPANYVWLTVRAMFNRSSTDPSRRLKNFFIRYGVTTEIKFSEAAHAQLVIVSSDINTGQPILHGTTLDDKILDALLLSTALPPWFMPVRRQDRYLMDGAVVSNLPVEPALSLGANRIIAFDLTDSRELLDSGDGMRGFMDRLLYSVEKRQSDLEIKLAEARKVPLLYLGLTGESPVPIWDFNQTDELISRGYEITRQAIEEQRSTNPVLRIPKE